MRVTNKTAGLISLTLPGHRGSIDLVPGVNDEVDGTKFQSALKARSVAADGKEFSVVEKMREDGKLEWDGAGGTSDKPLSSLSGNEAVKVVKGTYAPAQLDAYASQDSRPEVQAALAEQREYVASQNKPAPESETDTTSRKKR